LSHRFTHDIAAPEYNAVLPSGLYIVPLEELNDSLRGGRDEAGETNAHLPYIDGVETVYVLTWIDSLNYLLFVDVLGQGELDDEACDGWIFIKVMNLGEQSLLSDIVLESDEGGAEAHLLTGLNLRGYICLTSSIMPDEYRYQMGRFFTMADHSGHLLGNFLFDAGGGSLTIEEGVGWVCHNAGYVLSK
jgi:hypothetical protein